MSSPHTMTSRAAGLSGSNGGPRPALAGRLRPPVVPPGAAHQRHPRARPRAGLYAAYLMPQGRMIADMCLYEMEDGLLITAPRAGGRRPARPVRQPGLRRGRARRGPHGRAGADGLHGPGALGRGRARAGRARRRHAALAAFHHRRLPFGRRGRLSLRPPTSWAAGLDLLVEAPRAAPLREALVRRARWPWPRRWPRCCAWRGGRAGVRRGHGRGELYLF